MLWFSLLIFGPDYNVQIFVKVLCVLCPMKPERGPLAVVLFENKSVERKTNLLSQKYIKHLNSTLFCRVHHTGHCMLVTKEENKRRAKQGKLVTENKEDFPQCSAVF
jgi:hypothetical protein